MRGSVEIGAIILLSMQVSAMAVLASSVVGIPLGAWAGLGRGRVGAWASLLSRTGMSLPPVVVGLLLYLLLSRTGPLGSLGWLFTPRAMVLAQTILALPFVVGITLASVQAVPPDLILQVEGLGASPWQARWVVLREARSGIALAVATALGRSFSEVGAVLIVGGNIQGHTRVLTTAIVLETGRGDFAVALTLGGVLLAMALVVNALILLGDGKGFR
ncbi:ABC transporter permease [Tundrisphaera lichenicola]|uniref:ABC transporter permease n=1 Tax=Tundrisphaera lichenicola TaxID=2029860 RepID=UPI003EBB636D